MDMEGFAKQTWLLILLSFEQILNFCFDMADLYCAFNVSCLTFITKATNFFVTVYFEIWNLYWMMTNDPIWTDALPSFISDSSETTFWFISSEYWLILTKPLSSLRQMAEKIPGKGVHCLLLVSIRRYWFFYSLHLL